MDDIGLLVVIGLIVLILSGCKATLTEVRVAVPVVCQATEPTRPVMPTEALTPDASLDAFVQAATAEIERREGFETQLVEALRSCTTLTEVRP